MSEPESASGWPEVRLASVLGSRLISGGSKFTGANGEWRPAPADEPLGLMATRGHRNVAVGRAGVSGPPPEVVRAGDFLVCRNAGTPDRLGQGVLVKEETQLLNFPSTMTRVRVRPTLLHPAYLEQLWQSSHVREQVKAAARSGRTHSLTIKALLGIRIPLPPLAQQERILAALRTRLKRLDRAEAALRRASLGVTELQDAAHHVLTARCNAAAQMLPHGWRWGRLDEVIERIEAGHSPQCLERPAESDERAVIKTSAITRGRFLEDENKAVPAGTLLKEQHEIKSGDILLCRANSLDHVGATVRVTECRPGLYLSDKSLRLVPKPGIDHQWLVPLLTTPYVRAEIARRSNGTLSSMRNITQTSLQDVPIPIAPLHDQVRLGRQATQSRHAADHLHLRVHKALESSALLRRALADVASAGRIKSPDSSSLPQEEIAPHLPPQPSAGDSTARQVHTPGTAAHQHSRNVVPVQLELEL
ncbi:hypothetical protein OHO83_09255 [Streptomyces sp. NBC_00569]|uniref:hypothetical protein n=1 Tax=Streptomyces sp. NBC_00569 TaxID=2975780 RepID=UPI002E824837|nr:hypothetical protein [Streptomyces sp. NBC_00569]WUB92484.1 hypothetical protein OHO83_09255 [Streptomyces sp. NBC_00569]